MKIHTDYPAATWLHIEPNLGNILPNMALNWDLISYIHSADVHPYADTYIKISTFYTSFNQFQDRRTVDSCHNWLKKV